MAVAYRNSAGNISGTGTVVVSVPTGTVNGDLMIAVALRNSTDIPSLPAGWTDLGTANAGPAIRVCYRVASSEPANYSFVAAGSIAAIIATYSGAAAASFINQFSAPNRLTSTTSTALSVTPSVSNCMLVYVAGEGTVSGAWTGPSGWNQRSTQSGSASVFLADLLQGAAASTGNISATHASGNSYASLVAIAPAVTVTGAATLTATATLSATGGVAPIHGTAALSGTGLLSASGARRVTGSAVLSGAGTAAASGVVTRYGSAALSGVGTLTATGHGLVSGSASLIATSQLTATGHSIILGAAALSGGGTLAATGSAFLGGAAHLTGQGVLSATGSRVVYGEAHLTCGEPVVVEPPVIVTGGGGPVLRIDMMRSTAAAHLFGLGSLHASGQVIRGAVASMVDDDEEALRLAVELLL